MLCARIAFSAKICVISVLFFDVIVPMGKKKERISVDSSGKSLTQSPFGMLSSEGLPEGKAIKAPAPAQAKPKKKRLVKMRREKAGRGGKEVTLLYEFQNISAPEIQDLMGTLKKRLGTGGKCENLKIEIQGDKRDAIEAYLSEQNFDVKRSGG